ncbi:hypothetical protein EYM_06515 [Ignicoccus islandicus DSM 13165]|uniref:Reelin domain-containing protein n=1 Tax=Ignicoccus islandicus DSM 13165 TaxID=940295 RepID=A0A0U2U9K9_9CREN|nr:hypothetical protein EYM_06515 [Ignicoccus islandicus DSM 13165]
MVLILIPSLAFAMSNGAPALECSQCHMDAKPLSSNNIVVEGLIEKDGKYYYEPGKFYKLKIKIVNVPNCTEAMVHCGGFAFSASAGKVKVVDHEHTFLTSVFDLGLGGMVEYVTHTEKGSLVRSRAWEVSWKAPEKPVVVGFRVASIVANGDASPNGDMYGVKIFSALPYGVPPEKIINQNTFTSNGSNTILLYMVLASLMTSLISLFVSIFALISSGKRSS